MSAARDAFCERIGAIRGAITDFKLADLPLGPLNASHNKSARIIRNGLAVQCFNVFEDFVKARTGEILAEISAAGIPFGSLPEEFRRAATVDAIKAINYQMTLPHIADRVRYAQDYGERVASTKGAPFQLAEIAFFHSSPNISKEHFQAALSAFDVEKAWPQVSGLSSRIGTSAVPAENVFLSLAQRRHRAAHDAGASVSELDLSQSLRDAVGLAVSFDILISKATPRMCNRASGTAPLPAFEQSRIPLRFIKFNRRRFVEIKEGASRGVRANSDALALLPSAAARAARESGVLVVYDETGIPSHWIV